MDLNLVVISGPLAAEPEYRSFPSGSSYLRLLVTTRTSHPRRRVDVVPAVLWDPPADLLDAPLERGQAVWVIGAVQRRFWSTDGPTRSRIEVVAHHVKARRETGGRSL